MANNFGFFPAPGTNYTKGQEPAIAAALRRMGHALKLRLIGISGYRTPAHSVAVGGFADDPHTRGEASDTGGAENIPESTLERFGLTRPFAGAREANHIQLLTGGTRTPVRGGGTRVQGRQSGPADWLRQAGWPSNLIPIMVAIGGAESRWRVNATHKNDDGSTDYGWLQINSAHGYDPARLTTDPVYNARAGLAIYKAQGLDAWTTYTSGAYKSFMGQAPSSGGTGRVRPGGESSTDSGPDTEFVSFWSWLQGVKGPSLIDIFKSGSKAVNSTTDFLKWIAWIFHPFNILRVVEFLVGFPLILMGIWTMIQVWRGAAAESPISLLGNLTPAGRVVNTVGRTVGRGGRKVGRGAHTSTE